MSNRSLQPISQGHNLVVGTLTSGSTLIQTAKLNEIDPQPWLADTLSKIAETLQTRLGKLLPWNWMSDRRSRAAA